MTTRTETKQTAQSKLLGAMQTAFCRAYDENFSEELIVEMSKQTERVEKIFGYEPGSWSRGC